MQFGRLIKCCSKWQAAAKKQQEKKREDKLKGSVREWVSEWKNKVVVPVKINGKIKRYAWLNMKFYCMYTLLLNGTLYSSYKQSTTHEINANKFWLNDDNNNNKNREKNQFNMRFSWWVFACDKYLMCDFFFYFASSLEF